MSLRVARARTRFATPEPLPPERLAAWQTELAAQDGEAIAARWVGPGEWLLIRRLPLHVHARLDAADSELGRAFAAALDRAIAEAVAAGDAIRYSHRRAALADLVYRSSLGETGRQWAWQRMGLIERRDCHPEAVLRHALRLLEREPELAWPVLGRLWRGEAETAAFTAALRALEGSLVPALLGLAPRSRGYLDPSVAVARDAAAQAAHSTRAALPASAEARQLLHWCQGRPLFARRHRPPLAALLAAFEAPAAGLTAAACGERLAQAQAALQSVLEPAAHRGAAAGAPAYAAAARQQADPRPLAAPAHAASVTGLTAPADTPAPAPQDGTPAPAPFLPEPLSQPGEPTAWGGALFWLTRLHAAWLALDPRPELPALLHATALRLGVPDNDPAFAAFCGGAPWPDELPADALGTADTLVRSWEAWLAEAAPDWPESRTETVCRRAGWLRREPGWVELHLPMANVDTVVRRLLLDLDPGWLPWLGCVVRICYDGE